MRILLVTQYFWPEPSRANDLALALSARGHQAEVLTGLPNYPAGSFHPGYGWRGPWRERFQGVVPVHRVPVVSRGRKKNWRLALNYATFAASASLFGALRGGRAYDAILVWQPSPVTVAIPGLVAGRRAGAPVLLWIQDLWPDTLVAVGFAAGSALVRWVGAVSRRLHRMCDRLLVQSPAFVPALEAAGIEASRIAYLPNWAEDHYRPVARSQAADPMAGIDGFRVLFAGNIGSAQSFETVLEAAELVREEAKEIRWVVVGDGNRASWLRDEIARRALQPTVRMIGWQPAERMPEFFAHADVLLVSLRPEPVFGLTIPSKLQTYLACGRPVVAALDGEGATLVRAAGAGMAAPAGDAKALADCVLRLYRLAPAQREALGAAGRAFYERHFARERLLERLEACIMEARERRACAS